MTSKKFNVTQVKLAPRPRSERKRTGGGVSGGSTVITGGSQSGGGVPRPHALTHSKGGGDPLRPHEIGAATAEHLHDDKYHPLGGSSELDFEAGNLRVAESAEVDRLHSPNHDGLDRRGYVVEQIGDTGQYVIRIHSAEIFGELTVNVLTVSEQRAVIGAVVNTCAGCEISMVEELSDRYRCYYQSKFGQWWMVGDQPECKRVISGGEVSNYYWRLVVAVGSEQIEGEQYYWFDMSKSVALGSGVPAKGDQVANCGHRGADARRKNYIITSAWGESPYTAIYKGIDDFSLEGKRVKYESAELVEIASDVFRLTSPDGRTITPPVQVRADGEWSAARVPYFYYQQVMHKGFAWLCIDKASTGTGIEPSQSAHSSWICTSKDYDGELAHVKALMDGVAKESSANAQRLVAMSSDGILSREEKVAARSLWQQIELSYTKLVGLAVTNSVSYAALTAARNALEVLFITVQLSSDTDWVYPAMGQVGSKMDYDTKLSNWGFEISKLSDAISKNYVDAVRLGVSNLINDSKPDKPWTNNGGYPIVGWTNPLNYIKAGKTYTVVSELYVDNAAATGISFFISSEVLVSPYLKPLTPTIISFTFTANMSGFLSSYYLSSTGGNGYIFWIKIVEGNKTTLDWGPSIADTKNKIEQGDNALSKIFGGGASPKTLFDFLSDNLDEKSFAKMTVIKNPITGVSTPIMAVNNLVAYNLAVDNAFLNYLEAQKINVTKGGVDRIQIRAGSGTGDGINMFVGNVLKMSFTPALIPPLYSLLNPTGGASVIISLNALSSASYNESVTNSKESTSIYISDNLTYIVTTPPISYSIEVSSLRGFASASVTVYLKNKTTGNTVALIGSYSSSLTGLYVGDIPGRTFTIAQSGEYFIEIETTATAQDTEISATSDVRASSTSSIFNGTFSILRTNTVSYQYSNGLFLIYDSVNYDYIDVGGTSQYRRGNYVERLDSTGRRKSTNAGADWVNM